MFKAGRGTRPFSGKEYCILLDHAGNVERHEFPTDEPEPFLDKKKEIARMSTVRICKQCFCAYPIEEKKCPECGFEPKIIQRTGNDGLLEEADEKLVEIENIELDPVKRWFNFYIEDAKEKKRHRRSAYYKMINKFGPDKCRGVLPDYFMSKYGGNSVFSDSPYQGFSTF